MKKIKTLLLGSALLISIFFAYQSSAHMNPDGCTGSGLGIGLFTNVSSVQMGNTITYSVRVFNSPSSGPALICQATGITASITTPDGINHPIALTQRTSLLSGESDTYTNVVTYTARSQDVSGGTLASTATVAGTIHQNDTDSIGGGNQGINTQVTVPPAVPSSSPSPSTSVTPTPTPSTSPPPTPPTPPVLVPVTGGGGGGANLPPPPPPVIEIGTTTVTIIPVVILPIFPNTGVSPYDKKVEVDRISKSSVNIGPARIEIPSIGVDAKIENISITPLGVMGTPDSYENAGWYNLGPRPGERGTAIIDGHFGWSDGLPAVFDDLHKLKIGEKIYTVDTEGALTIFVVRGSQVYRNSDNIDEALGKFALNDDGRHLALITCGGVWDNKTQTYSERLVVYADKEVLDNL